MGRRAERRPLEGVGESGLNDAVLTQAHKDPERGAMRAFATSRSILFGRSESDRDVQQLLPARWIVKANGSGTSNIA